MGREVRVGYDRKGKFMVEWLLRVVDHWTHINSNFVYV
jgi:hypothetical protein